MIEIKIKMIFKVKPILEKREMGILILKVNFERLNLGMQN
jgi:hypothetical protein